MNYVCRKCGNQINDEQAMFCPKCGEQVLNVAGEQPSNPDCCNIFNTGLNPIPTNNTGLRLTFIGLCGAVLFYFIYLVLYIVNSKDISLAYTHFFISANRLLMFCFAEVFIAGVGHLMSFIKQKRSQDLFAALMLLLNSLISVVEHFVISILQRQYINDRTALNVIFKLSDAIRILIPLTLGIYALMLILKRKKKPFLNVMLGFSVILSVISIPKVTRIIIRALPGIAGLYPYTFYLIPTICLLLCLISIIDEMRAYNMKLSLKVIIPIQMALAVVVIAYYALRLL